MTGRSLFVIFPFQGLFLVFFFTNIFPYEVHMLGWWNWRWSFFIALFQPPLLLILPLTTFLRHVALILPDSSTKQSSYVNSEAWSNRVPSSNTTHTNPFFHPNTITELWSGLALRSVLPHTSTKLSGNLYSLPYPENLTPITTIPIFAFFITGCIYMLKSQGVMIHPSHTTINPKTLSLTSFYCNAG